MGFITASYQNRPGLSAGNISIAKNVLPAIAREPSATCRSAPVLGRYNVAGQTIFKLTGALSRRDIAATGDDRTPKPFAKFGGHGQRVSVLDCGSPLPLFKSTGARLCPA